MINEIARLQDFAISEIERGCSNSSTGETIKIEEIDRNTMWEVSEKAYQYSNEFYYARVDASEREPHFLEFFLMELSKIQKFGDLLYEFSFSEKLLSVEEEISERHEEEMELIEQRHEKELDELHKFQEWIEKRNYSSSQIDSLKSIFEMREKGILEVSELPRIFNKIPNLESD